MRHHHARSVRVTIVAAMLAALVQPASAPAQAPSPAPLVVIDPGHGGPYSNANANGLREKTVNLQIALELRTALQARGYRVAMTRTTDRAVELGDIPTWNWSDTTQRWTYAKDGHTGNWGGIPRDDLQARVDYANNVGADLFISIHNNGAASRSARGTETFGAPRDGLGHTLAPLVHQGIIAKTGLRDRGVGDTDYYVMRWTNMPAILVEGGFITNPGDAWLLKQSWFRRRIATGIAIGVDKWMASGPYTKRLNGIEATGSAALAAAYSKSAYAAPRNAVVIARENRPLDAPSAPALARKLGAPLLWSGGSRLPTVTAGELRRLLPRRVVLVGVAGSYDASLVASVASASALPTAAIELKTASSREALAASIATSIGVPANGNVLIASATDTDSVLAAVPVAVRTGSPLLLSRDGMLGAEAQAYLASCGGWINRASLVGSATAVPYGVASQVTARKRYNGDSMAAKARALNADFYTLSGTSTSRPVVADPRYLPDYLTASLVAARTAQPLLPATGRRFPVWTREWITHRRLAIAGFTVLDGHRSLPNITDHMLLKSEWGY